MSFIKRPYLKWGIIPNFRKRYEIDQNRQLQIFYKGDIQTVQLVGMTTSVSRGTGLRGLFRRIFDLGDLRVSGSPGDFELLNIRGATEFKSALDGKHPSVAPPVLSTHNAKDRELSSSSVQDSLEANNDTVGEDSRAIPSLELSESEVSIPQIPSELWSFLTATKCYRSNTKLASGDRFISVVEGQLIKRGAVIVQLSNNVDGFSYHMTRKFPAPRDWASRILYFFRIGPNTTNIIAPFDCKVSSCNSVRAGDKWDESSNAPRSEPILTLIPAIGESTDRAVETAYEPFLTWIENWIEPPEAIPDEIVSSSDQATTTQKREYAENLLKWIRIVRNYSGIKN